MVALYLVLTTSHMDLLGLNPPAKAEMDFLCLEPISAGKHSFVYVQCWELEDTTREEGLHSCCTMIGVESTGGSIGDRYHMFPMAPFPLGRGWDNLAMWHKSGDPQWSCSFSVPPKLSFALGSNGTLIGPAIGQHSSSIAAKLVVQSALRPCLSAFCYQRGACPEHHTSVAICTPIPFSLLSVPEM